MSDVSGSSPRAEFEATVEWDEDNNRTEALYQTEQSTGTTWNSQLGEFVPTFDEIAAEKRSDDV